MAIVFTLGGVVRTTLVDVGSLAVTDQLNGRNTANFDMNDAAGGYRPTIGEEVVVTRDGTRIFAGFVASFDEEAEPGLWTQLRFNLSCVDYNAIADQRLVAQAYTTPGQTLGDIVADLVDTFLSGEGVTTANVQTGPVIERAVWNYQTVAEAFNDLADLSGYLWFIDYNKVLTFCARDTNAAPFALGDTTHNFRKMKVTRTREQYRNRQIIRAGVELLDAKTESFKGDGTRKTFTVGNPVGAEPVVEVDGVAKTVGIRGLETGFDWYWNKGSTEITQDDAGTPLTSSNVLEVTSRGQIPLFLDTQDDAQITARKGVEGGSGLHEHIEDFPNVESTEQAEQAAQGLLTKYGRIPKVVTFETDVDGLAAGQLLTISNTVHDLSGSFLIESVELADLEGTGVLRYQVKCLDGTALGGWEEFFRALARMGRRFVIRENEVVVQMRAITESVTCLESLAFVTMTPESRVGFAIVGISEVGS